jgi:hypothetical protein
MDGVSSQVENVTVVMDGDSILTLKAAAFLGAGKKTKSNIQISRPHIPTLGICTPLQSKPLNLFQSCIQISERRYNSADVPNKQY